MVSPLNACDELDNELNRGVSNYTLSLGLFSLMLHDSFLSSWRVKGSIVT